MLGAKQRECALFAGGASFAAPVGVGLKTLTSGRWPFDDGRLLEEDHPFIQMPMVADAVEKEEKEKKDESREEAKKTKREEVRQLVCNTLNKKLEEAQTAKDGTVLFVVFVESFAVLSLCFVLYRPSSVIRRNC